MTFSPLDSLLTGPLFATEAMRDVFSDRARLGAMLAAEAALARAQAKLGLVPEALPRALEALSPDAVDADAIGRGTTLSGVPTVPFVTAVRALLPNALRDSVHLGSTTQDILDTALVLQVRDALALVEADTAAIVSGLLRLAEEHRSTPCSGRTYGQHAAPVTFGFKAAVWCAGTCEVAEALPRIRARVLTASCGGPAGTLGAFGAQGLAVADGFAAELGLGSAPIAWHVRRARIVETGAWLATLLGALAKFATDVSDLVSTDVGEAAEPHVPGRGGSSAMPHKRNPVSTTVILSAALAAKGHVVTLLDAMAAAHERPAGAWHAEWHALPQLFGLASGALHEARFLAEGLEVHPDRMLSNLEATRGLLFADVAASRLAAALGRDAAHAAVTRAADEVRRTGESLRDRLMADPAIREGRLDALVGSAFELTAAVAAAETWTDRAVAEARRVLDLLSA